MSVLENEAFERDPWILNFDGASLAELGLHVYELVLLELNFYLIFKVRVAAEI